MNYFKIKESLIKWLLYQFPCWPVQSNPCKVFVDWNLQKP